MHMTRNKVYLGGASLVAVAALAGTGAIGAATADTSSSRETTSVGGELNPLNNSGVTGHTSVDVNGRRLHVEINARHLAQGLPHAQHIHFGQKALHECPNIAMDKNGDFRLTTSEGAGAYGPVRVSLTTTGDTSAGSVLAVDRYPTAPKSRENYTRNIRVGKALARGIRRGHAVIVLHGVDYNHNGEYDFKSAGKSDLDKSLPAEATDPASCAVLRVK
jgi:hypothetical protein